VKFPRTLCQKEWEKVRNTNQLHLVRIHEAEEEDIAVGKGTEKIMEKNRAKETEVEIIIGGTTSPRRINPF
jgi:hypothetical protein